MRNLIPAPIISLLSDFMPQIETHASLDSLFMYADAPGDPPGESKPVKVQEWLRRCNKDENINPLDVLGRLIEKYMEADCKSDLFSRGSNTSAEIKAKIEHELARYGLNYIKGGRISTGASIPSKTLEEIIVDRDWDSIHEEFDRAIKNVDASPRESVSAASNILESVCKTFIEEESLDMPSKQGIQGVWNIVRKELNFDPSKVEDKDLKMVLSGLISIVSGIGALRTHASSAHGSGCKKYRLEPRHARLSINSAHTVVTFIIESWNKNIEEG